MSRVPIFHTVAHGMTVPVVHPQVPEGMQTPQGIAIGRLLANGVESFQLTISHIDGSILTSIMDEAQYARFLGLVTITTNSFNADHRNIRFGEHG